LVISNTSTHSVGLSNMLPCATLAKDHFVWDHAVKSGIATVACLHQ